MAVQTVTNDNGMNYNDNIQQEILKKYKTETRWFWSALLRYPIRYLIATILMAGSAFTSAKTVALVGNVVGILSYNVSENLTIFSSDFITTIIWMIVYIAIGFVGSSGSIYIWADTSFRFQRDIRQEFYEVIQQHSMAFFDVNDSGVVLSMGMNEVNQIRLAMHPSFRHLLNSFFTIVITTYLVIEYDWIIGTVLAAAFVVYFIIAWFYAERVGPIRKKLATDLGNLSAVSQEMFKGVDTVRSFDNHEKEITKFNHVSEEYATDMKREGYLSSFYWPALITIIITAAAFAYGLYNVIQGNYGLLGAGVLISILGLLLNLNRQNFMIPAHLINLQAGLQNAKRLWNVMDFNDPLVQPKTPQDADWDKTVGFDNVSFAYPGTEKLVLKNVSFSIPPGARVALIGGPGSGKSTILKLILRLYDPTEGTINVGGVSIESMHTNYVRSNVTMVEQDIFLFSDTLKANITFSKPDATSEEIRKAAERAQIATFIDSLPEGYDTVIGERGVTLSGGQRQRVAIARAMLSNPRILLLDDSTSAVDIKTELRLRYAMDELMRDRTSIVVTQRLTTLVAADIIIFMKRGSIIGIGKHKELLKTSPDYQFMCKHLPMTENERQNNDTSMGGNA